MTLRQQRPVIWSDRPVRHEDTRSAAPTNPLRTPEERSRPCTSACLNRGGSRSEGVIVTYQRLLDQPFQFMSKLADPKKFLAELIGTSGYPSWLRQRRAAASYDNAGANPRTSFLRRTIAFASPC